MANTKGYQTKARQLTIAYLSEHKHTALSASAILNYLHENELKTNITTVYRYLDQLTSEGQVLKYMDESGEKSVYQYVGENNHCHEHLHLKCITCGNVIHLDCSFMEHIKEHIMEDHGFDMECSNSILYGYCKECKNAL